MRRKFLGASREKKANRKKIPNIKKTEATTVVMTAVHTAAAMTAAMTAAHTAAATTAAMTAVHTAAVTTAAMTAVHTAAVMTAVMTVRRTGNRWKLYFWFIDFLEKSPKILSQKIKLVVD